MSYYFRERPRFGERFRGKSGEELLQELKEQFGEDIPFFDAANNQQQQQQQQQPQQQQNPRGAFERHTSFPRVSF